MTEEQARAVEEAEAANGEAEEEEEKDLETKLKEAVEVDVEDLGGLRKVTVSIPRELLDGQVDEQYAELSESALVPGFRRGRAPRRLIEKRFGREVNEQLVSQMLGSGYLAAIEKVDLKTVSDPMIWVGSPEGKEGEERLVTVEKAIDEVKIPAEGNMTFACEVEVRPEFELPKLDNIPLTKPQVGVSDEDVDTHIDRMRGMGGTFQPAEGKIEADDLVVAEVKMSIDSEVVQSEDNMQIAARGQQLFGVVLEGLGDDLVGKKGGDQVKVKAEIPDDFENSDWRGKKASYEINIHEFKRLVLPPIDEAFLSQIGFESEEDLRKWVRDDLESRLNESVQQGLRSQVYKYLLDSAEVALPEGMSSRQTDRVVMRRVLDMRKQGVPDAEINKHIDELRTSAKDEAAQQLKMSFIMEKIAEEQDVHVSEEEVNSQIAQIAARYNRRFDRVRDDLSKGEGLSSLYLHIRDEKIIDGLVATAEITEAEARKEEKKAAGKGKAKKAKTAKKKTKAKTAKKDEA